MCELRRVFRSIALIGVALGIAASGGPARAGCNEIPDPNLSFRAARGTINQPFASPGDIVEIGALEAPCASPSLADVAAGGYRVTLVYQPQGAAIQVRVLAPAADCPAVERQLEDYLAKKGGTASAQRCEPRDVKQLAIRARAGGERAVSFAFPDHGFGGPTRLAISRAGANESHPMGLETTRCADLSAEGPVLACVDALFENDGTCGVGAPSLGTTFSSFVTLPPPNDYAKICTNDLSIPKACTSNQNIIKFALDLSGNVYVPFRWSNILRDKSGTTPAIPERRLLVVSTAYPDRYEEDGVTKVRRIRIPDDAFLQSYTDKGKNFLGRPEFLFKPLRLSDRQEELTFIGESDKGRSVLKILRKLESDFACEGGANVGETCNPGLRRRHSDCRSVFGSNGKCKLQSSKKFSACDGGPFDGDPCSRSHQCGAGFKCVQTSSGPGALFDLSDQLTNGFGIIARSPTEAGFGVCEQAAQTRCENNSDCGSNGPCIGFRAEAQFYTEPED